MSVILALQISAEAWITPEAGLQPVKAPPKPADSLDGLQIISNVISAHCLKQD